MKTSTFVLFICCLLVPSFVSGSGRPPHTVRIVPTPMTVAVDQGSFIFKAGMVIAVEDTGMVQTAKQFAALFTVPAGFTPQVKPGVKRGELTLKSDRSLGPEAYRLSITPNRITVWASCVT